MIDRKKLAEALGVQWLPISGEYIWIVKGLSVQAVEVWLAEITDEGAILYRQRANREASRIDYDSFFQTELEAWREVVAIATEKATEKEAEKASKEAMKGER